MPVDYTYTVARLRSIEAELPDKAWFQRLARTARDAVLQTIREYYRGFERVAELDDFERGLEAERASCLDLITSLVGDGAVISFLRSGYDFDDALHLVKARSIGGEAVFSGLGLIDPELFEKTLVDGDFERFPGPIREFLAAVAGRADKEEPAAVQYYGENLKYRHLLDTAPDREARRYARMKIDLANIVTFVRLKRSKLRSREPDEAFIGGGTIPGDRLAALVKEPEDELYSFLQRSDYRRLPARGLAKDAPLWQVEAAARVFLLDVMGESRMRFFDITPVLFHIELRNRDEHVLRTVLTGKSNGLPEEHILERVDQNLLA